MKAVVTVVGCDKIGIISGVSSVLSERNVNVMDITQTLMHEYFTMTMLVDLSNMKVSFPELKDSLEKEGERLGVSIRIQHEDIFKSMHRI